MHERRGRTRSERDAADLTTTLTTRPIFSGCGARLLLAFQAGHPGCDSRLPLSPDAGPHRAASRRSRARRSRRASRVRPLSPLARTWCSTAARDPPEVLVRVRLPSSASSLFSHRPGSRTGLVSKTSHAGCDSLTVCRCRCDHMLTTSLRRGAESPPACHAGDHGCESRRRRSSRPSRRISRAACPRRRSFRVQVPGGSYSGVEQSGQLGGLITRRSPVRIRPPQLLWFL